MALSKSDRSALCYDDDGTKKPIRMGEKNSLRCLQAFYHYQCTSHERIVQWTDLTCWEMFQHFLGYGYYNPNDPIVPYPPLVASILAPRGPSTETFPTDDDQPIPAPMDGTYTVCMSIDPPGSFSNDSGGGEDGTSLGISTDPPSPEGGFNSDFSPEPPPGRMAAAINLAST